MTYDIYTKALQMLKDRENHHGKQAHRKNISHVVIQSELSAAGAYNSAWWILYYAIHEDWDSLDQFDYYHEEQD